MNRIKLLIAAAALASTGSAWAHVTVWPKESTRGAREKYEVRVPNEKQVDTIAVEVRFPAGLRVTSLEQKAGWVIEPQRDASGRLTGARWTGKLSPQEFTEFGLLAVNPTEAGNLSWTAVQSYADRSKVEWVGPLGSKAPAPSTMVR